MSINNDNNNQPFLPSLKKSTTIDYLSPANQKKNNRSNNSSPSFFFQDGDDEMVDVSQPIPNHSILSNNNDDLAILDVLNFPTESNNAYSYNQISPNSLALRLNVLKRSLEILNDRPELIDSLDKSSYDALNDVSAPPTPINNTFELFNPKSRGNNNSNQKKSIIDTNFKPVKEINESNKSSQIKIETNASSAALAAFFRSENTKQSNHLTKRSSSLNTPFLLNNDRINTNDISMYVKPRKYQENEASISNQLKSIINLLNVEELGCNEKFSLTLNDLSLNSLGESKEVTLRRKLLYALATPFYESISTNNMVTLNKNISSVALNQLSNNNINPNQNKYLTTADKRKKNIGTLATPLQLAPPARISLKKFNSFDDSVVPNNNHNHGKSINGKFFQINQTTTRPFHSLSTSKNSVPQAIITCDTNQPWIIRSINDLSTLLFNLNSFDLQQKNIGFMELIASNSKQFVLTKLLKRLNQQNDIYYNKDILFAGEIVAINQPKNQNESVIHWCSLWAKKKDNLIFFMFNKIPCLAIDLLVKKSNSNNDWDIEDINEISGKLLENLGYRNCSKLSNISKSLEISLNKNSSETLVDKINDQRYFTLNLKNYNLPCAVLTEKSNNSINLKIHTLPYIAGIFIISSNTYNILSYNKSISKNLFGQENLVNKSITEIIPSFKKVLEFSSSTKTIYNFLNDLKIKSTPERNKENFNGWLLPGLVLPEHFFRKIAAKFEAHKIVNQRLKGIENEKYLGKNEEEIEDSIFLNSQGIIGRHSTGGELLIDIQLRVSNNKSLVLWVTYSNELYKKNGEKSVANTIANDITHNNKSEQTISTVSNIILETPKKIDVEDNEFDDTDSTITNNSNHETILTSPTEFEEEISNHSNGQSSDQVNDREDGSKIIIKSEKGLLEEEYFKYEQWESTCSNEVYPQVIGSNKSKKSIKNFKIIKSMGEGAYGKVLLVCHVDDPNYKIILKCIYKDRILVDSWIRNKKFNTIPAEIDIMNFLSESPHPNCLKLLDFFEDDDYFYLELPILGNPPAIDLFDYIEIKKSLSEIEIKYIFRQLCQAIKHLHSNNIVHRDLKDENVIIDENSHIKLIDYGSSSRINNNKLFDVFVGTLEYASPEVLKGESYNGKPQDIWALGVLLYTMIYKENPFYNIDEIMEGELNIPYILNDELINLLDKMLNRKIDERPTIEEVLDDPWLN